MAHTEMPNVGDTLLLDGGACTVQDVRPHTGVIYATKNDTQQRVITAAMDVVCLAPGVWGVRGRVEGKPAPSPNAVPLDVATVQANPTNS